MDKLNWFVRSTIYLVCGWVWGAAAIYAWMLFTAG